MATILPFIKAPGDASSGRKRDLRAVAEIVIFPGVRVEYHDDPPKPAGDGTSRKGGRRRQAKAALSA